MAAAQWGVEGATQTRLHLCLEAQRGGGSVSPSSTSSPSPQWPLVCVCVCGKEEGEGLLPAATPSADWPRPHLAVESAGAGSHDGPSAARQPRERKAAATERPVPQPSPGNTGKQSQICGTFTPRVKSLDVSEAAESFGKGKSCLSLCRAQENHLL